MLAIGRPRVEAEGLDNVDFRVADAMHLHLEDGPFDAAVSGLTWMFLPDPLQAAAWVWALLRPAAWFAASVWGPIDQTAHDRHRRGGSHRRAGDRPALPAGNDPDLSHPRIFHETLWRAGFIDVAVYRFPLLMTGRPLSTTLPGLAT
jgi:SAM-dependent methyltransferase